MYVIKNALKCISRSKGRNVLIGIIVLVIAVSSCIGLSIRQAAESTKSEALENLTITGTISFDRRSMMSQMGGRGEASEGGEKADFDKAEFSKMMGESSSLTLEEYQKYAEAESVKDFYYTLTLSVNGSDAFEPVTAEAEEESDAAPSDSDLQPDSSRSFMKGGMVGNQSDFQIVGYSEEAAMTSFINGTAAVTDGIIFEEGTTEYDCIISEELASFNGISVGDKATVTNPNNEEEVYELNVVGIYTDSSSNESSFSMNGMTDPANKIYMSYAALQKIVEASEAETEEETSTAMTGVLSGTYVFSDVESYEAFETEVRELGLDESYTVSSQDLSAYETSLTPLNSLSTMAGWFLIVILIIGAIILIVLNIFNVRERKYEIGVLTAMGMKKSKVALQFLTEIFVVTLAAVIIGAGIGAVSAVPVTNALLENQVASQQSQAQKVEKSFGRGDTLNGDSADAVSDGGEKANMSGGIFTKAGANYITQINSAMNLTVALQMLAIAVLLTLIAGAVSMLFVMRYEPLKILANRD